MFGKLDITSPITREASQDVRLGELHAVETSGERLNPVTFERDNGAKLPHDLTASDLLSSRRPDPSPRGPAPASPLPDPCWSSLQCVEGRDGA